MTKTDEKYSDGSFKYLHACTRCKENTYLGPKRKTTGYCTTCLPILRVEAANKSKLAKRDSKLLTKVANTKLALDGLSKEALREIFDYHVEGVLTWKDTFGPKMQKNTLAGSFTSAGYKQITFNNTSYYVHRLVYIYHNGDIPSGMVIDHIDRDPSNNRLDNLRCVSSKENAQNTLPKGWVYNKGTSSYISRIVVNGEVIKLGYYDTEDEARDAYYRGKSKYHIKDIKNDNLQPTGNPQDE